MWNADNSPIHLCQGTPGTVDAWVVDLDAGRRTYIRNRTASSSPMASSRTSGE